MSDLTVGTAFLAIVPSFDGFGDEINRKAAEAGRTAGEVFSSAFNEDVDRSTSGANVGPSDAESVSKGDSSGGKFADGFKARVTAAVKSLPDINLNADSSDTDRKISFIRGELDALGKKTVGIDISDTDAKLKLDDLKLKLVELSAKSTSLQVKVDTSSAVTEITKLGSAATSAIEGAGGGGSGGLSGLTSSLSGIGSSGPYAAIGIGLLATTLIPIAGIATAGAIGLTGMAVAAGAAVGAFGLAAIPVFTQVSTAIQQIDADQKAIARSTSLAQYATNVQKLNLDMSNLNPTVATLVQGVLGVKQAFLNWDAQFSPAIVQVFNSALADVKPILNDITPLVYAGAAAVSDFFHAIGNVANSADFKSFVGFLAAQAGPAIKTIVSAVTIFGQAFGDILQKSGPLIKDVEKGLIGIAGAALKWVDGGGFQKFLNWVKANGPTIVKDVKDIAKSLAEIIVALAPVGIVVLDVLDAFTHLGGALSVSNGFIKGIVATFIVLGGALALVLAPLIWLGSQWDSIWNGIRTATEVTWHAIHNDVFAPLVNFFTETIPHAISVVSGAFTTGFQAVHNIVNTVWHAIDNDFVHPLTDFFTVTIPQAVSAFVGFFTAIPGELAHVWSDVLGALHAAWSDVANWVNSTVVQPIVSFFEGIPGFIAHVWSDVVTALEIAWIVIAGWVDTTIVQPVVAFFESIPDTVSHVWTDLVTALEGAWNVISGWVDTNVVQPVVSFFTGIPGAVSGAWSTVVGDLQGAWGTIAGWVDSNVIQPVAGFFTGLPGRVSSVGSQIWNDFTSGLSTVASWVTDNVVNPVVTEITNLPSQIVNIGGKIVSGIADGIRNAAGELGRAVASIIPHGTLHIGPVSIPYAQGGIISGPTHILAGEDGAEAILPLTKPARMAQILGQIGQLGSLGTTTTTSNSQRSISIGHVSISGVDLSNPLATKAAVVEGLVEALSGSSTK